MKLSDQDKIDVCQMYTAGGSISEIATKYNCAYNNIRQILVRRKTTRRRRGKTRQYQCDHKYFSSITNENRAYWLGFIYAEGNVYKNTFSLMLSNQDRERLDRFVCDIGGNNKIETLSKKGKEYCRLRISSSDLINDLKSIGVCSNKTDILKFPKIDPGLHRHFIRGFLDGDGWVSYRKKRDVILIGLASNSEEFLKSIQQIVCENVGIKCGSLFKRKNKKNWNLSFEGKNISKLVGKYLFEGCESYMLRKKAIFNAFVDNQSVSL